MDPVLEAIRAAIKAKMDERAAATAAQTTIIERAKTDSNRNFTEVETAEFRAKSEAKAALDAELDQLRARETERSDELVRDSRASELRASMAGGKEVRVGGTKVLSEERTYNPESSNSFFRDVYRMNYDFAAQDRLRRNLQEAITEREFRTRDGDKESRAVATGAVASLVIPQYLTELNAPVLRKGRPVANLATRLEMPDSGMSFVIPRGTTGGSVAAQATQNTAMSTTDEVWADLTVSVSTIAGKQNVSRQILERGAAGVDRIVYTDLIKAYAAEVDREYLYGLGSGGEMLGILKTAGLNNSTAFGAALTATALYLKLAGAVQAINSAGAGSVANAIIMSPRRWAWLLSLLDTTGRPLVVPEAGSYNGYGLNVNPGQYSGNAEGPGFTTVGVLQGLPVITDANIPITAGTLNEDLIAVVDTDNLLLWEDGDGMPNELRFDQTQGDNLTVILGVYGYVAGTAGRYPALVSSIGGNDTVAGNGLIAPTF